MRYSAASAAGTVVGQGSLAFGTTVLEWSGVVSNLVAVSLGTIPNYAINRYWTWQKAGRERMGKEIGVFWLMAVIGLVVSTVFVAFAERHWDAKIAINLANLAGFGILWVAKFFFLDRVLYRVVEAIED